MQGIEIEYADVLGFPGYRVGTDGSVWSSRRRAVAGATVWIKMAPHPRRDDRLRVYLRRDGRRFLRAVHRLVLESFVGPPDGWRYHGVSRAVQVLTIRPSDRPPLAERLGLNTN